MTDARDPNVILRIAEAKEARAQVATLLVGGSCSLALLTDYRRWLTVSRLLGDISDADAQASYERACNVYAANCGRIVDPMVLPPFDLPPM